MAIAKQTVYNDWESVTVKFQRKDGEKRVRLSMQSVDVMTGEITWHHAIMENVGNYPESDKKRFLYELRTLYLNAHHKEFNADNHRPDPERFNTDPEYAWLREINMPETIFY